MIFIYPGLGTASVPEAEFIVIVTFDPSVQDMPILVLEAVAVNVNEVLPDPPGDDGVLTVVMNCGIKESFKIINDKLRGESVPELYAFVYVIVMV